MSRTDVPEYPRSAKQDAAAWTRRLRVGSPPFLDAISGAVFMDDFKQTFDPGNFKLLLDDCQAGFRIALPATPAR
jgi:hypothetical protein